MRTLKIIIKIAFIMVMALIFQSVYPWWTIAIAAFMISYVLTTNAFWSFMTGFLAIALLWLITAAIIDVRSGSILTERVAAIFNLPNSWSLIFLTAFIGGLVGGLSAMTATYFRYMVRPALGQ